MADDTRYSNPVSFEGAGARIIVGIQPGGDGPLNRSVKALAAEMTKLRTRAAEIREHSQLLPSERSRRLEELRAPAIKAVLDHRKTLAQHQERIQREARTASWIKPTSEQPGWKQVEDQMLVQKFMAMSISERTQVTARAMSDPKSHVRWAEALLRAPRELTDIPEQMHDQLRSAVLMAFDPDRVNALEVEQQQLEHAQRAFELAQGVLSTELPGSITEMNAQPEPEPPQQPTYVIPDHVMADLRSGGFSRMSPAERAARVTTKHE